MAWTGSAWVLLSFSLFPVWHPGADPGTAFGGLSGLGIRTAHTALCAEHSAAAWSRDIPLKYCRPVKTEFAFQYFLLVRLPKWERNSTKIEKSKPVHGTVSSSNRDKQGIVSIFWCFTHNVPALACIFPGWQRFVLVSARKNVDLPSNGR